MKVLGKITLVLAFVCTLFIMNPMNVEAASGRIMFTDLTIAAGEEFDIVVKVVSYEGTMDSISIDLKYDSSKVEFLSGASSTGGDGTVKISATSTGSENNYTLKFRALKKGDTSITISNQTIKTSGGTTFQIQEGNSAISIEGGVEVEASTTTTPSEEVNIEEDDSVIQIAGIVYEMSEDYLESEIPIGYTKEKMEIRGENISIVKGDTSGIILVYLEAPGETIVANEYGYTPKGKFFRYDQNTGKYSAYVQITVSDSTYIVFLTEDYEVDLATQYIPTTMTADGFDFPAWQDAELEGYYLIYAINSKGIKGLYRYDVTDQSYQRFEVPPEPENPNEVSNETLQIIIDTIANNLIIVLIIAGLVIFLLLSLTITFGVKLRNRNKEIDDIYEEGVTAYSANIFDEFDKKPKKDSRIAGESEFDLEDIEELEDIEDIEELEDIEEDWEDDLYSKDTKGNLESMLDDGLTQEFDISMADNIFNNDGFVDYGNEKFVTNVPKDEFAYDDFEGFEQKEEDKSDRNIGGYNKYQPNDDDDIEFIEL